MKVIDGELDLAEFLCPGDRIVLGNACGEPVTLAEALLAQAGSIGGLSAFIATSFSGLFTPEAAAGLEVLSMGAIGALRTLARAGRLGVIPCHLGQVGPLIETGLIGCDVAFVQVSTPDAEGNHSLGLVSDHVRAAVARARVVVAEVNDQVPFTYGERLAAAEIDYAVPVSRPPARPTRPSPSTPPPMSRTARSSRSASAPCRTPSCGCSATAGTSACIQGWPATAWST